MKRETEIDPLSPKGDLRAVRDAMTLGDIQKIDALLAGAGGLRRNVRGEYLDYKKPSALQRARKGQIR